MKNEMLRIDRITSESTATGEREVLGYIPLEQGDFLIDTLYGQLNGQVCPPNGSEEQKVILKGPFMETIKRKGGRHNRGNKNRRVVKLPLINERPVRQEAGEQGIFEFRRTLFPSQDTVFSKYGKLGGK